MSLCLIDVHGDIEGDFEWVEDLPRDRKEFLIATAELKNLKNEMTNYCDLHGIYDWGLIDLVDERIKELGGE